MNNDVQNWHSKWNHYLENNNRNETQGRMSFGVKIQSNRCLKQYKFLFLMIFDGILNDTKNTIIIIETDA